MSGLSGQRCVEKFKRFMQNILGRHEADPQTRLRPVFVTEKFLGIAGAIPARETLTQLLGQRVGTNE